jgi:hypothetical protein
VEAAVRVLALGAASAAEAGSAPPSGRVVLLLPAAEAGPAPDLPREVEAAVEAQLRDSRLASLEVIALVCGPGSSGEGSGQTDLAAVAADLPFPVSVGLRIVSEEEMVRTMVMGEVAWAAGLGWARIGGIPVDRKGRAGRRKLGSVEAFFDVRDGSWDVAGSSCEWGRGAPDISLQWNLAQTKQSLGGAGEGTEAGVPPQSLHLCFTELSGEHKVTKSLIEYLSAGSLAPLCEYGAAEGAPASHMLSMGEDQKVILRRTGEAAARGVGSPGGPRGGQAVSRLDDATNLFPRFPGLNPEADRIGRSYDSSAEVQLSGLRAHDFDDLVRDIALVEARECGIGESSSGLPYLWVEPKEGRSLQFRTRFFPLHARDSVLFGAGPDDVLLGRILGFLQSEYLRAEDVSSVSQLLNELEDKAKQCTRSVPGLAIRRPGARLKFYQDVLADLASLSGALADWGVQHAQVANLVSGIQIRVLRFVPAEGSAAASFQAQPSAVSGKAVLGAKGGAGSRGGRRLPAGQGQPQPVNKRKRTVDVRRGADGRPVMPIVLTPSQYVLSLGRVVHDRPNFHSNNYIWPAGYRSVRMFFSAKNPSNRVSWTCEILDVGEEAPEFRLTPEDDRGNTIVGHTATAVWSEVLKLVKEKRVDSERSMGNISGPEYFGFSHPTIARLLEELPDAQKCSRYKFQYVGKTPDKL